MATRASRAPRHCRGWVTLGCPILPLPQLGLELTKGSQHRAALLQAGQGQREEGLQKKEKPEGLAQPQLLPPLWAPMGTDHLPGEHGTVQLARVLQRGRTKRSSSVFAAAAVAKGDTVELISSPRQWGPCSSQPVGFSDASQPARGAPHL